MAHKKKDDTPSLRVRQIFVTGNKRTKEDVIRFCLAPIASAKSLSEVQLRVLEANRELQHLGIFKSIKFLLDDVPEGGSPEPGACDLKVENKMNTKQTLLRSI